MDSANHNHLLLSTSYFGPLSWFSHLLSAETVTIDRHEHYRKQTWRNRCRIVGPNGVQDLVIPVRLNGNHTPVSEVRIDYSGRWQQQHWGALFSAYGQAPFFGHYAEKIRPFYEEKRWEKLVDFNRETLELCLHLLKAKKRWNYSEDFLPYAENDLRLVISPKNKNAEQHLVSSKPYIQVFSDRHGFIPDLSMLDLLFCCGPVSLDYLATAHS